MLRTVEIEDLSTVLQKIMTEFVTEVTPIAVEITQHLVCMRGLVDLCSSLFFIIGYLIHIAPLSYILGYVTRYKLSITSLDCLRTDRMKMRHPRIKPLLQWAYWTHWTLWLRSWRINGR